MKVFVAVFEHVEFRVVELWKMSEAVQHTIALAQPACTAWPSALRVLTVKHNTDAAAVMCAVDGTLSTQLGPVNPTEKIRLELVRKLQIQRTHDMTTFKLIAKSTVDDDHAIIHGTKRRR